MTNRIIYEDQHFSPVEMARRDVRAYVRAIERGETGGDGEPPLQARRDMACWRAVQAGASRQDIADDLGTCPSQAAAAIASGRHLSTRPEAGPLETAGGLI